ncbi:MAG: Ppx/GppA phosphatase family protein [Rhodospirillaceae bacterium]
MSLSPAVVSVVDSLPATPGRVAVVDIGSNTVRLVVYDAPTRLPIPIFNEKAECGLARGLNQTGRLNPDGIIEALRSLKRFSLLSQSMNVEKMVLLATAAVREAEDGQAFVTRIAKTFGREVRVLSGEEEAKLSATGLMSGRSHIDGLLADVGGGSVDIVELKRGKFGRSASLPLGHLRLRERAHESGLEAAEIVAQSLAKLPWLSDVKGGNLFLAGGACRALARLFIDHADYPLHVIDGYKIRRGDARRLCQVIIGMGPETKWGVTDISKARLVSLPFAAAVVGGLLEATRAKKAVFSGFGMREGQMLEMLPKKVRNQDPLLAGCARMEERTGRFTMHGEEIFKWMAPLFPKKRDAWSRLRMAACMLSDIGWSEHPDYRAEHTFLRALRLPFAGLTHHDRVFLALALFVSYKGDSENAVVAPVRPLLQEDDLGRAETVGSALRLAYTLSGGAPGLLPMTRFEVDGDELHLVLSKDVSEDRQIFTSEAVERRLDKLARTIGLRGRLV